MSSIQYVDTIKTRMTIVFTNEETLFKQTLTAWLKEQGWSLRKVHKCLSESRLTFTREFDSIRAKNVQVAEVIGKINELSCNQ